MQSGIDSVLQRYRRDILHTMWYAIAAACMSADRANIQLLDPFYGQMRYHMGWVDRYFQVTEGHSAGKLLRPVLLLLVYEACGAWGQVPAAEDGKRTTGEEGMVRHIQRALPAAAAVELAHNFTLLHDDIEDGDTERRHRATVWTLWGVPQAINTGDGLCALARLTLWEMTKEQVEADLIAHLGRIFDEAILVLTEGQFLDISFEDLPEITVDMYMEMIGRKTATLMRCASEMGARLGTRDEALVERMRRFGWALGLAFQIRDDMLLQYPQSEATKGEALAGHSLVSGRNEMSGEKGRVPIDFSPGKRLMGDIYQRKKSLPIVYALAHADKQDRERLRSIYNERELSVTPEQAMLVLEVLEKTGAWEYCQTVLAEQCREARDALLDTSASMGSMSDRAREELLTIIDFVDGGGV